MKLFGNVINKIHRVDGSKQIRGKRGQGAFGLLIAAVAVIAGLAGAGDYMDNHKFDGSVFDSAEQEQKVNSFIVMDGIENLPSFATLKTEKDGDLTKYEIRVDHDSITNTTKDLTFDVKLSQDFPVGATGEGLTDVKKMSRITQPINSDLKWTDDNDKTRTILFADDVELDGDNSDKKVVFEGFDAVTTSVKIPLNPDSRDLDSFEKFEDSDDEVEISLDFSQKDEVILVLY